MTDDKKFRLSRRKALGALGTIGAASAGAGLGTSAFFSDEETFTDNKLAAGALDLKVDWEEHYSDWSDDESEGLSHSVKMSTPNDTSNWVGLPDPTDPLIWVHMEDLGTFMDNTSLEAYPDSNNDGVQDDISNFDFCNKGADTPEDLDPTASGALRTENDDTYGNGGYYPLVNLHDVKPGDFGELTLSFHLCDNPGYIWFNGAPVTAAENGHTEPEGKDTDENGAATESYDVTNGDTVSDILSSDIELLDAIQTKLWYDEDGDNVYEPGGTTQEVDVAIVLDRSGSMGGSKLSNAKDGAKMLVDALGGAAQVSVISFASNASLDQSLTTDKTAAKGAIDALSAGGSTNIEGAVDEAHDELINNGRTDADDIMVVLSDGAPNVNGDGTDEDDANFGDADPADNADAAKQAGIEMYTIGYGISSGSDTAALLEEMASDPKSSHFYLGGQVDISNVFGQIGQILRGEEAFFEGSLRDLLGLLSTDHGIPLDGNRATPYDEVVGDDTDGDGLVDEQYGIGANVADNRECFTDSTTNALGLAWWLPVDHANEIQTDSVSFDLGFYTEQCRHNDGAGQAPETSTS